MTGNEWQVASVTSMASGGKEEEREWKNHAARRSFEENPRPVSGLNPSLA